MSCADRHRQQRGDGRRLGRSPSRARTSAQRRDRLAGHSTTIYAGQALNLMSSASDPDGNRRSPSVESWRGSAEPDRPGSRSGGLRDSPARTPITLTATDALGEPDPTPDTRVVTVLPAPIGAARGRRALDVHRPDLGELRLARIRCHGPLRTHAELWRDRHRRDADADAVLVARAVLRGGHHRPRREHDSITTRSATAPTTRSTRRRRAAPRTSRSAPRATSATPRRSRDAADPVRYRGRPAGVHARGGRPHVREQSRAGDRRSALQRRDGVVAGRRVHAGVGQSRVGVPATTCGITRAGSICRTRRRRRARPP